MHSAIEIRERALQAATTTMQKGMDYGNPTKLDKALSAMAKTMREVRIDNNAAAMDSFL